MDGGARQVVVIMGDRDGALAALVRSLAPEAHVVAVGADGVASSRSEATRDAALALIDGGPRCAGTLQP